jgi:hypothetical protein
VKAEDIEGHEMWDWKARKPERLCTHALALSLVSYHPIILDSLVH